MDINKLISETAQRQKAVFDKVYNTAFSYDTPKIEPVINGSVIREWYNKNCINNMMSFVNTLCNTIQ